MSEELLRKPEEKKQKPLAEDLPTGLAFDYEKFHKLIALRREKLESIKALIPLKTYHLVQEKIEQEQAHLDKLVAGKKQEIARKQEVGVLPKAFFELHLLKTKSIRID